MYELGWQNSHTKRYTVFPKRMLFRDKDALSKFILSGHQAPPGTEWVFIKVDCAGDAVEQPPSADYYHRTGAYVDYDDFLEELNGGNSYEALLIDTRTGKLQQPLADRSLTFGALGAFDNITAKCSLVPNFKWVIKPLEHDRPRSPLQTALHWLSRDGSHL